MDHGETSRRVGPEVVLANITASQGAMEEILATGTIGLPPERLKDTPDLHPMDFLMGMGDHLLGYLECARDAGIISEDDYRSWFMRVTDMRVEASVRLKRP